MKHTISVTTIILIMFLCAQFIGLLVVNNYIDHEKTKNTNKVSFLPLPLGLESPQTEGTESFATIMIAVLLGTVIALVLIKFRMNTLWKFWFLIAIFVTLTVSFNSFIPEKIALVVAGILAIWKVYKPNFVVHNFTELFIYGGLAAIFINMLDLASVVMLLIAISIYDAYAVWKSKHMVKLAKFQTESKVFAGAMIPYSIPKNEKTQNAKDGKVVKTKTAILGGGDIGFPLLFASVIFKQLIITNTLAMSLVKIAVIPVMATIALGILFYKADKDKFYPAMPFISAGCFLGYGIMYFFGLI